VGKVNDRRLELLAADARTAAHEDEQARRLREQAAAGIPPDAVVRIRSLGVGSGHRLCSPARRDAGAWLAAPPGLKRVGTVGE
jgi:hypothetical protein